MKTKLITVTEALEKKLYLNTSTPLFDINGNKIGYFLSIDIHKNVVFKTKSNVESKSHTNVAFVKRYI